MRGKACLCRCALLYDGITPAHAGKSAWVGESKNDQTDHPRTCGEKKLMLLVFRAVTGSPPHMRGKALCYAVVDSIVGITPAHAGKRKMLKTPAAGIWDHPRTCGEKHHRRHKRPCKWGSPPHMRGKAFQLSFLCVLYRITPAHAGKRLKRSRSIVPHAAIVPLFPSVCNKSAGSDGSPAGHDAPPFLPIENAVPASPAYNLRSL